MLAKLRQFIEQELDDEERALLVLLLAPGIAQATQDDELEPFGIATWSQNVLADALREGLRTAGVRVEGL